MSDTPDWENFAKAVLTDWPTYDIDGNVLFDLSLQYGMIKEVPGGYNPDQHIDYDGICPEEGDPWYVYTFRGEAGPGLYSVSVLEKRIKELEAENARLREAQGWQPIETAPTDGTEILGFWQYVYPDDEARTFGYSVIQWIALRGCWVDEAGDTTDLFTHWMPLPEAPKETTND